MSAEYCLAAGVAVIRRPNELTLLALDGRLDPQPIVVRDSGVEICDALASWISLDDLVATVNDRHAEAPAPEIEAGVRQFVDGLCDFGIVAVRVPSAANGPTEHAGA